MGTKPKVRLYIRVRRADGRDLYADSVLNRNRTLRAGYAFVNGLAENHPEGVYYLRYARAGRRVWDSVGRDPDRALVAQRNAEHDLRGIALGRTCVPAKPLTERPEGLNRGLTVVDAIAIYMAEVRAFKAPKTISACAHMLEKFGKTCTGKLIDQVTRIDLLDHMTGLKKQGLGDRTVFNHISRVNTLLKANGISQLLRPSDWPKYDEKDVNAYHKDELLALFASATPEDQMLFEFFLGTGFREQEVMYASWANVNFRDKVVSVRSKPELGFRVKDREERSVPVPDSLIEGLNRLKQRSTSTLLFPTKAGKPNGHMLRDLQNLALKAGLSCGECVTKSGKECATVPVCSACGLHKSVVLSRRCTRKLEFRRERSNVGSRTRILPRPSAISR